MPNLTAAEYRALHAQQNPKGTNTRPKGRKAQGGASKRVEIEIQQEQEHIPALAIWHEAARSIREGGYTETMGETITIRFEGRTYTLTIKAA